MTLCAPVESRKSVHCSHTDTKTPNCQCHIVNSQPCTINQLKYGRNEFKKYFKNFDAGGKNDAHGNDKQWSFKRAQKGL